MKNNDKEDIKELVKYLRKIPMHYQVQANEFGYRTSVLICIDAVLSINRQYFSFVVPRVKRFEIEHDKIDTLDKLVRLITEGGLDNFSKIWNYKHDQRIDLLLRLSQWFIKYSKEQHIPNDLLAMKNWAKNNSIYDYKNFKVNGIGIATFQYLRMMLGVSTVKPDVHIKKAVSLALNRKVGDIEAIYLIELASKKLNLEATFVDHNLWRFFAKKENQSLF